MDGGEAAFVPRSSPGRFPGAGRTLATETARGAQSRDDFEHNRSVTRSRRNLNYRAGGTFDLCFWLVGYFVCFSLFDSCRTMFPLLVLLSQLPVVTFAFPHCTRSPSEESRHAREEGKPGCRSQETRAENSSLYSRAQTRKCSL